MIYGLLGRKLGHSFSVPIHKYMGCEDYKLIELEPEELALFLKESDIGGLNVTIPYKRDVMPLLDEIDDTAREIGAVNVIVRRGDKLVGFNTDKYGFEYAVKRAGIELSGKKAVILGSGGTSRTAHAAARSLGASETAIISRSGEDNYHNLEKHADAEVLINTTPVGMHPNCPAAPLSLDAFPKLTGVMDVVYNPLRTALVIEAERRDIPAANGLMMLVAQAKAAEELFFQRPFPDTIIDEYTAILRRDASNIVLIGMPGSGKTAIGRAIARLSGRELVDMDAYIRTKHGVFPRDIITAKGEAAFRKIETAALAEVMKTGGRVVTTGGGTVTRPENYTLLRQNGRIYRIERPLDLLATGGRPLSKDVRALYEVRKPMYDAFADVTIENTAAIDAAAREMWREFNEAPCD